MINLLINVTYYDPRNKLFKGQDNREHVTRYECECAEMCDAYKNGQCVLLNPIGFGMHRCPHGSRRQIDGYTQNARKFGELTKQYKNEYAELLYKLKPIKHVQKLADSWFLNLPWLTNDHSTTWESDSTDEEKAYQTSMRSFFKDRIVNEDIVKDEDFNVDFICRLLDFRPKSWLNDNLWGSFRADYLPQFFYDLRKYYGEIYEEIKTVRPEVEDYANRVTFKGKRARLLTLKPGQVKVNTVYFNWDGKQIETTADQAHMWGNLKDAKVIIIPTENSVVEIVDDNTVSYETIFE